MTAKPNDHLMTITDSVATSTNQQKSPFNFKSFYLFISLSLYLLTFCPVPSGVFIILILLPFLDKF